MDYRECSKVFKALADPKRLEIVDVLSRGEECACNIQERFDITQPTMSHDLKVLIDANILIVRTEGKWKHYKLNNEFLDEFKNHFSELTREKKSCNCKK